jgi:branched-chain amino acid transport system permease protein
MLYREAGDFKTNYVADNQTFPIKFDRYGYYFLLGFAFLVMPLIINDYWANSIVVPFLIYAIAALGLNILIGYCGQLRLGQAGSWQWGPMAATS